MALLAAIPSENEILSLIGTDSFAYRKRICSAIDALYDMDKTWRDGGKRWKYEYKVRRGGKTLCALYARQDRFGLMIIFGKEEREKVESIRNRLSNQTEKIYDEAETFHDGKWVMFDETVPMGDIIALLGLKRKPNKQMDR